METVYISHPFTGDETKNREEAEQITVILTKKYPYILFINPLSAMIHTEIAKLDYNNILKQCIELMNRCDSVIMTGDWKHSKGCMVEHDLCDIPVYESVEEFCKEHKYEKRE